ncbi:MAG: hypothetical protein AB1324_02205 [Candidatus Micrarchaeota archaeon]
MVSITLAVPAELKKEMDEFPEINWSAVARDAIKQKIILLRKFREFTKESQLTDEDALSIGKQVNKSLSKRYQE